MSTRLASACLLFSMLTACEAPPTVDTPPVEAPRGPDAISTAVGALTATTGCRILPTAQVTDSGESQAGLGAWLRMDLGTSQPLTGATIAWHRGNERSNPFTLETSEDGTTYTPAYADDSALTQEAQTYRFAAARTARYLRITVTGNTVDARNAIADAHACGDDTEPSPR